MDAMSTQRTAILLIDCPDQKGLVSAIADFLYHHGANILHADQHQDHELESFFMRVEWDLKDFDLDATTFINMFEPIALRWQMRWRVAFPDNQASVAFFVSRQLHCFADLLHRHQIGELACNIALIISNHTDAEKLSNFYDVPFHHIPINIGHKIEAELCQLELLREYRVDLIVLARYMQILSADFVARYPHRIINVHHSFLPAFVGGQPYHAAFNRGVKLIGATSHYVTDKLDDGPIIEQETVRISHRDRVSDLIIKGRDTERIVLARAVKWHLEHRVLCYANKTVIFD